MSELGKLMRLAGGCAQPLFSVAGDEGLSDTLAEQLLDRKHVPFQEHPVPPARAQRASRLAHALAGFLVRARRPSAGGKAGIRSS